MRNVLSCALVILLSTGLAHAAGESEAVAAPAIERSAGSSLDDLFHDLKRSGNEAAAARIASRIQREWTRSGSRSIDLLMQWASVAMQARKFDTALDLLDQVVTLSPDYAEGWNRRATVHFMMNNYALSMSDIDRTLRLEPRHFGALAGMAQILQRTGRKEPALKAYERVLDVYPMMRNAQDQVGTLADELAGEGI
ncbi:tetratricopeptide repeat protein [Mesorhizobium sp. YIM 152430]|uniref:tetratricopeptide repeat protein n=1 Tax=Mesorhizobium sp. YIM 152430 TaxID=3031761 RepID=UPI0023D9F3FE|nr:tetratricopeptide repeat protein [Mesorhizobium sp. YIM 152430]MDF1600554.1 tetratricopeptide repeat protein [Mesorhizobium sp. YIM 152430]